MSGKKIGEWFIDKRTGNKVRWVYDNRGHLVMEIMPGEWQTDEQGRRFRWVGNVKEHEMIMQTTKGNYTLKEWERMKKGE